MTNKNHRISEAMYQVEQQEVFVNTLVGTALDNISLPNNCSDLTKIIAVRDYITNVLEVDISYNDVYLNM
jgi:hypothetical protein